MVESALQSANVTLTASTGITVNNAITWSAGTMLTLSTTSTAGSIINIDAPITATAGTLAISSGSSGDTVTTNANGSIDVGTFVMENGSWVQNGSLPSFSAGNFELQNSSSFLRVAGGSGAAGSPYQITDVYGLQGINSPSDSYLADSFELVNNINASGTAGWNSGAGFSPIGANSVFTGTFDGMGHTISSLFINSTGSYVGLFGDATGATIANTLLTSANVAGGTYTGIVLGYSQGTTVVADCYSSGTVTPEAGITAWVGGITGYVESGTTTDCTSVANVNSPVWVAGGVVGENAGTVEYCVGGGNVFGQAFAGGVVGGNIGGVIADSWSSATVSSPGRPGGLSSTIESGSITDSFSYGTVTGSSEMGGLTSEDYSGPAIDSFWDVDASGVSVADNEGAGTGEPTSFFSNAANFPPSWDFTTVWQYLPGATYPTLRTNPYTVTGGNGGGGGNSGGGASGGGTTQPTTPNNNQVVANNQTGGVTGNGSNIVPPAIVPQTQQVTVPPTIANLPGAQPTLVSFQGDGTSSYGGSDTTALAESGPGSGSVGANDTLQLNDGQVNNVANPHASGALNQALGPAVFHSLSDALSEDVDWTSTGPAPGDNDDTTADSGGGGGDDEVILSAGDVAEVAKKGVKNIPLDQAPDQLKNAMSNDTLQGMKGTGH